jgi:hypothetical protein
MVGLHRCVCDNFDDGSRCLRNLDKLRALTGQITVIEHINRRKHRGHGIDTALQHFVRDFESHGRQTSFFVPVSKIICRCRGCHGSGLRLEKNP